jgi:hypothetical protein
MMLFLCKPVITPTHVTVDECRIVMARPTARPTVYEVEVQDAPPVTIKSSETITNVDQ